MADITKLLYSIVGFNDIAKDENATVEEKLDKYIDGVDAVLTNHILIESFKYLSQNGKLKLIEICIDFNGTLKKYLGVQNSNTPTEEKNLINLITKSTKLLIKSVDNLSKNRVLSKSDILLFKHLLSLTLNPINKLIKQKVENVE